MNDPKPDARHDAGEDRWIFPVAFVVVIGLAVSLLGMPLDPAFLISVIALGGLYYFSMVRSAKRLEAVPRRGARAFYFASQLLLCAAIFWLFARQGSFGMQWLILMPLFAEARLWLRPAATAAVCVLVIGAAATHLYLISGWASVPGSVAGLATATVFVLFFTQVAMRESEARADSDRLGTELAAANQGLAAYAVAAEELATVKERERLAREIHDSLGHVLTGINIQLEAAQLLLDREPGRAREAASKAQSLAQEGLAEVRRSVAALRSAPLENQDLDDALARLVARSRVAGTPADLEILGASRDLSPQVELTLYRTVQEGLTNVRKHARAATAGVILDYRRPEAVRLTVRDDGVGSDDPTGGFGLLGVRERVRQLGGRFEIRTGNGDGLTLELEVPG